VDFRTRLLRDHDHGGGVHRVRGAWTEKRAGQVHGARDPRAVLGEHVQTDRGEPVRRHQVHIGQSQVGESGGVGTGVRRGARQAGQSSRCSFGGSCSASQAELLREPTGELRGGRFIGAVTQRLGDPVLQLTDPIRVHRQ
jgi:hypothetical protein